MTVVLAFVAGLLTVLSPCVLPILPIVFGTAAAAHRLAPVALALGLALSFTLIGLFVATLGFAAGIDAEIFRTVSAVMMVIVGVLLLSERLQAAFAAALEPLRDYLDRRTGGVAGNGLAGQFAIGTLLGAVWSPCVGPTLGAASVLASQGKDLPQVAVTMVVFGLGAAIPLLILGSLSRRIFMSARASLGKAGAVLKSGMGIVFIAVGALILTKFDKSLETFLVGISPDWLNRLTTAF